MKRSTLTNRQKAVIHQAAQKLGLIRRGDDEQYRLVLRNICGVDSSTKMTQRHYDQLMAFFRDQGFSIGKGELDHLGKISSRQKFRIQKLSAQLPDVNLSGVIAKCFGDHFPLDELTRFEAPLVISALQDILNRQEKKEHV